ncbi:MAG: tetratricopeptide repeat protein [Bacteroidales bacterium]|nr:tetratricopeptide repeat protein [Bacteroidales bacterium]
MSQKIMLTALSALVLMGGASCSKKLGQFKSEYFTLNPEPLEVQGRNVPATVAAAIPAKFMQKNAQVQVTPVLVYATGETPSAPYLIQGENVRANGTVVNYQQGGSVMIPFNVAYSPAMAQSTLYLDFAVDQNGKKYTLPRVKIGNGVVATATLADPATVTPATARDAFQRIINEKYSADIHFLINQANVRGSELTSKGYTDLGSRLREAAKDSTRVIEGISVSSYASPEGSYDFNKALAERREQSTNATVRSQLSKDKIAEFGELTSNFTPEDWEGFRTLVQQSNIQDKALILDVLSMQSDPELREKEIRNLSGVFDELADQILPQLRYSRVQASINVIGKSDEQLVDYFNNRPQELTADEILYIATLTGDNNKKMDVYNKACEIYPQDYRAFNNLGLTQYVAGDYEGALANFDHALRLNPQAREPEMNRGLIQMLRGEDSAAQQSLGMATGVPEAGEAMGVYYLQQGNVQAAVNAFGDSRSNNAALARILNKDYAGARDILSSIGTPDATTYYLTAVLGARTGNEGMVLSNLRQAVRLNPSMLDRAKNDLEFSRYSLSML